MKKDLPNIILIVCDTLGAKHMSLYGYERKTTPHLERLVDEEGFTAYTRCFAPAPWTSPSHASLFTGLYPSEHGTDGNSLSLNKKFYVLPELLKHTGYYTIALSNNPLVSKTFEYDRGFDKFYEPTNLFSQEDFREIAKKIFDIEGKKNKLLNVVSNWSNFDKQKLIKFLASKIYTQIRNPLRSSSPYTRRTFKLAKKDIMDSCFREKSFFLFMNIMQTHHEFNPPKKYRDTFSTPIKNILTYRQCLLKNYCEDASKANKSIDFWKARYDEEILFLDSELFSFYQELKKADIVKDTIFIITSDHGEMFGEMGHFAHMFTTYNTLIHIPLLIKFGENIFHEKSDDKIVQLHDLFATLMDIIDSPFPKPESSCSLLANGKRDYAISQDIYSRRKIDFFLGQDPNWNFKAYDFIHSNISLLREMDNTLYKATHFANGKLEFYKFLNKIYEETNTNYHLTDAEKHGLQNILDQLLGDFHTVIQALPKDEYDVN